MSIIGLRFDSTLDILFWLERKTNIELFLTGSRFFGTATESSDYDFYAQMHEDTRNALLRMGFKPVSDEFDFGEYNADPNIAEVLRYECNDNNHIDVQLVHNIEVKDTVQYLLQVMGVVTEDVPKEKLKHWWQVLTYKIAEERGALNTFRY